MSRLLLIVLVLGGCRRGVARDPGQPPTGSSAADASVVDPPPDAASSPDAASPPDVDRPDAAPLPAPSSWKVCATLTQGGVHQLGFSGDGEALVAAYGSGLVEVLSVPDRRSLFSAPVHTATVTALALAGGTVATAAGRQIVLWRLADGQVLSGLTASDDVRALAFSADGTLLRAGREIFRVAGGLVFTLPDDVRDAAFSVDGLVVLDARGSVRTLAADGSERGRGNLAQPGATLQLSPDGRFAVQLEGFSVALWDLATRARIWSQTGAGSYDKAALFASGSIYLRGPGFLELRDLSTGTITGRRSFDHDSPVAAVSPGGDLVVFGGGQIQAFRGGDGADDRVYPTQDGSSEPSLSLAVSADGRLLSAGSLGGDEPRVRVWDLPSRRVVRTFRGAEAWVLGTAFSPDGALLAVFGDGAHLGRLSDGQEGWSVNPGQGGSVDYAGVRIALGPQASDGRTLAAISREHQIDLHRSLLLPLEPTMPLAEDLGFVGSRLYTPSVAFSPDGQLLVSADAALYRVSDRQQLWSRPLPIPSGPTDTLLISWAAFSPRADLVAVSLCPYPACVALETQVLNASDGTLLRTVTGGRNAVFSLDGKMILAGNTLIDLATGVVRSLPVPAEVSLFAPDWSIVAASGDGVLRLLCPER